LLTFRDDEVGTDHPLRVLLGELATVQRVRRIAIRSLSRAAVQELARGSHCRTWAAARRSASPHWRRR
jgi:hypothetical protein